MSDNKPGQVEDIFADTDRDRSKPITARPRLEKKKLARPTSVASKPVKMTGRVRISRLAMYLLLPLVVIAGGAALVSSGVFSFGEVADQTVTNNGVGTTTPSDNGTSPIDDVTAPPNVSDSGADSDGDGLSNEQEQLLGTDPLSRDTDSDGLFDREEVEVYETDPLDSDSDNDGNLDGIEVAGGYNPNGVGLLLDVNAAITNLNN